MNNQLQQYRINGFEQIKAFYSWVFNNQDKRITPQHVSLYLFLVNQNNRSNWVEWFKCPLDLAMEGSCIGNKKTYYTCITNLIEWELIEYQKGANEWKSPAFKLVVLNRTSSDTSTVPLPVPQDTTQVIPLPTTLPYRVYKLLTDNIKLITDNLEEVLIFLQTKKTKEIIPEEDTYKHSSYQESMDSFLNKEPEKQDLSFLDNM